MKSNIQKVYSKLPKTELSVQKVELGIMQETEKSISNHKKIRSQIDNSLDKWYTNIIKARDDFGKIEVDFKNFNSSVDELKNYIKEIENMAKQLGVEYNAIPGYNEAKAYVNTSEDIIDEYKEDKKLANKIK
jgi:archaellum component FlaC|tara:strand:- start:210 stop:605 length:396 start_codon:yes stop_codon:yes gene_type:complete